MTGNVVISEVDALTYVLLSKAEKHVACGELVGTTECVTLSARCRTNRGRYKRAQLYIIERKSCVREIIVVKCTLCAVIICVVLLTSAAQALLFFGFVNFMYYL
jgi:hypothetical protein